MPSSAIARPRRWSAATARSTGWGCRGSTAPPASPPCSAMPRHGRWLIAPVAADARVTRRYRGDTLILETTFETAAGARLRHRLHDAARRASRTWSAWSGAARDGRHAHRAGRPFRLRVASCPGCRGRTMGGGNSSPDRTGFCSTRRCRCAARTCAPSAPSGRGRRGRRLHADLDAIPSAGRRRRWTPSQALAADRSLLGGVGGRLQGRWRNGPARCCARC